MKSYIDTSVLAAYYLPEPLSEAAERLLCSLRPPVLSDLTIVEVQSAIARKIRQRELDPADAARARAIFAAHLEAGHFQLLPIERSVFRLAAEWIQLPRPLRSLDSLHLALAGTHELRLVTADRRLAEAATAVHVETLFLLPEQQA